MDRAPVPAPPFPPVRLGRVQLRVAAGIVLANIIGAAERFEYTVIGDAVNEAARLTDLAKGRDGRLLATCVAVESSREDEKRCWARSDAVTLRGRDEPTRLAVPRN